MAEARSAAALSFQVFFGYFETFVLVILFQVTHDGVSVSYDQELLRDIWHAFSRQYKRRFGRFKASYLDVYVFGVYRHYDGYDIGDKMKDIQLSIS